MFKKMFKKKQINVLPVMFFALYDPITLFLPFVLKCLLFGRVRLSAPSVASHPIHVQSVLNLHTIFLLESVSMFRWKLG